jgi:hypothetical protein
MFRRIYSDQKRPASSRPASLREFERSRAAKRRHLVYFSGVDDGTNGDPGDYNTLPSGSCTIRRPIISSHNVNSVHSVDVPNGYSPSSVDDSHFRLSSLATEATVRRRPRLFEQDYYESSVNPEGHNFDSGVALSSHRRPVNHHHSIQDGVELRSESPRRHTQDYFEMAAHYDSRDLPYESYKSVASPSYPRKANPDSYESVGCSDCRHAHHSSYHSTLSHDFHPRKAIHDSYESVAPCYDPRKAMHDSYEAVAPCVDRQSQPCKAIHDFYESVAPCSDPCKAIQNSQQSVAHCADRQPHPCTAIHGSYESLAPCSSDPGKAIHHDSYESVAPCPDRLSVKHDSVGLSCSPAPRRNDNSVSSAATTISHSTSSISVNSPDGRGSYLPVAGHPGYFFNPTAAGLNPVETTPEAEVTNHELINPLMIDDESLFNDDVLLDVFHDGLDTQGFIYEQPMEEYWLDKNRLDKLGSFSKERWHKMRCIHFILPNMSDLGQASTPKQANVPHHQTTLAKVQLAITSFRDGGGDIDFKVYESDKNYSNEFLHVVNLGVEEIKEINWDALARIAYLASNEETEGNTKRQHMYRDFGTTGSICTTRVGSREGVSKPRKKPGTDEKCIVEGMLALSSFTRKAEYKWLSDGMRPFNCDDKDDARNKFCKRFHKDCVIPASRVGLTNMEHPCGYHVDEMNSNLPQYECVPTFSKKVVVDGTRFRCALIGFSRRSVDNFLENDNENKAYIDFVCDEYEKFTDERKHLSPTLFVEGTTVEDSIPKFPVIKNLCNLDPWGHYSSILESTLLLDRQYKLSLPERISLLRAMAVTPNSAYLFVAGAASLLQRPKLDTQHRSGYRFGLLLANVMRDIHQALLFEKKDLPPRRFNCYATYQVPDEQEWKHQCDRLLILHLTTSTSPPKLKAERRSAYEKVRSSLANVFPYIDVLGGNHLAAIAGTLGILPLWVTSEIEIDKTGRSFEWLLAMFFENEKERSLVKPDDVISNLMAALKTRFVGDFSRRSVENIVCKVYRIHTKSNSDRRFFDILIPKQNLYSVHANIIRIMSADGKSTHKRKGPLLNMVPFQGAYVTSEELRSRIPDTWTGWERTVAGLGRVFTQGLFGRKRDTYPDFPFELHQQGIPKNRWLFDKFGQTEARMIHRRKH